MVTLASGALASGAFASGAFASGAGECRLTDSLRSGVFDEKVLAPPSAAALLFGVEGARVEAEGPFAMCLLFFSAIFFISARLASTASNSSSSVVSFFAMGCCTRDCTPTGLLAPAAALACARFATPGVATWRPPCATALGLDISAFKSSNSLRAAASASTASTNVGCSSQTAGDISKAVIGKAGYGTQS